MTRTLRSFTLAAIVFALCASASGTPPYTGAIAVGSITGAPGDKVVIPVLLQNNNIGLMALSIPLKYSSADVLVDSVSFQGTLLKPNMNPLVQIDNTNRFLRITYVPTSGVPQILETSGLLASIHFSIKGSAPEQVVTIDSVNKIEYVGPPTLWVRLEVADTTGVNIFLPGFSSGAITVESPLAAGDDHSFLPATLELKQNYPNPFNPSTTISFNLPERARVSLRVFNILGQEVATLTDDVLDAGTHEFEWDAANRASGVYFYRLSYQNQVLTKKMTLLK